VYSEEFIDSLANIYEYHVSNYAQAKSERIVSTTKSKIQHLKENPSLFSKAESKKYPDCRKIVVEEYVILYMLQDDAVIILNIMAGATDWKK
jgi:addiction module RelE/StbE family toxin